MEYSVIVNLVIRRNCCNYSVFLYPIYLDISHQLVEL